MSFLGRSLRSGVDRPILQYLSLGEYRQIPGRHKLTIAYCIGYSSIHQRCPIVSELTHLTSFGCHAWLLNSCQDQFHCNSYGTLSRLIYNGENSWGFSPKGALKEPFWRLNCTERGLVTHFPLCNAVAFQNIRNNNAKTMYSLKEHPR